MSFGPGSPPARPERELLADLVTEIESLAADRESQLLEAAYPHVEALEPLTAELAILVTTIRSVRQQAEKGRAAPAISDRMRHDVTVADVVAAVLEGSQLLDPLGARAVIRATR